MQKFWLYLPHAIPISIPIGWGCVVIISHVYYFVNFAIVVFWLSIFFVAFKTMQQYFSLGGID